MPPDLPFTIAEWPRNSRETVRIRLDRYNDQVVIDCRSWWRDKAGELRPGKAGLTLSARHLPALTDSLSTALAHARAAGHLDPDEPV
jgi:hypothetical protein